MERPESPLTKIFNLVAATHQPRLVIGHKYTPLTQDKVTELSGLLEEALQTREVQQNGGIKRLLTESAGSIEEYKKKKRKNILKDMQHKLYLAYAEQF